MKKASVTLILLFCVTSMAKESIHNISRFSVNWTDTQSSQMSDGLGCPGGDNLVVLTVAGTLGEDFAIESLNDKSCHPVLAVKGKEVTGEVSTTLIYNGFCATDNDENFILTNKTLNKEVRITVDSGC